MNSWPRYKSFFFFSYRLSSLITRIRLVDHDRHTFIACSNKFGTKVKSSSLFNIESVFQFKVDRLQIIVVAKNCGLL